jgi:hypothetical protein
MANFFPALSDELKTFIGEQAMYFVASAPLSGDGHINLSPKGADTMRVLSEREVAYLDLTGSGNETAAHIRENGRLTLMWCSFGPSPLILRLYGKGRIVARGSDEWDRLFPMFPPNPGARQITVLEIEMGQTSCGYAVPLYTFERHRGTLTKWAENKGPEALEAYRHDNNRVSLDGLETGIVTG